MLLLMKLDLFDEKRSTPAIVFVGGQRLKLDANQIFLTLESSPVEDFFEGNRSDAEREVLKKNSAVSQPPPEK